MRTRFSRSNSDALTVDLTPMIDMVFILLIFFLVTASFNKMNAIDIQRPDGATNDMQGAVSLVVSIDAESGVWIEGEPVDIRKLRSRVKTLSGGDHTSVMLNADRTVDTGRLIEVLDQIRLAGVDNVAVATAGK
ncbi:ExbD/TolR family protein [Moritella viscosa]|uniref:Biopolymer transport protein ExbD/TolR n=1 Tax=Moritella viscosa TaxID=80854 RepID=A0A090IKF4_9GAMM|nr:biopolymer transporter ExbD [Moritella viscosa]CED61827.1 TonB system transport protein ExbD [Moritella viscosa]SGY90996.1 Biopolymer transport protein ExbD/TolR [Moritella viscosa]SGZ00185.1 Biopolymer transport protein ExbD/TolR [Moritella viscosa]SGZ00736.1 Biopolymer transport protein ExbD/TolR [Moritella viscosa]SHO06173.1 Biopolymer transport protein ExbD/TolR [Moritella viscosa]